MKEESEQNQIQNFVGGAPAKTPRLNAPPTRAGRYGPTISRSIGNMIERGVSLQLLLRTLGYTEDDLLAEENRCPKLDLLLAMIGKSRYVSNKNDEVAIKEVIAALRIIVPLANSDVSAIDTLMDRIEGKAPQRHWISPDPDYTDMRQLSDEELMRIAAGADGNGTDA